MLLDPHYAYPRGVTMLDARLGLILTLEDSIFRETPGGRLSAEIDDWSVEKIKRAGGDAVKVLTWYRPDADPAVCAAQQDFTQRIGEACARYDIPFVFELLVYPLARDAEQTTRVRRDEDQAGAARHRQRAHVRRPALRRGPVQAREPGPGRRRARARCAGLRGGAGACSTSSIARLGGPG